MKLISYNSEGRTIRQSEDEMNSVTLTESERVEIAKKHNTNPRNIKTWGELSYEQKQQAYATFPLNFGVSTDDYAFELGASGVICRSKLFQLTCETLHYQDVF